MFKDQLTGQHVFGISPDGNYFLYWKDNKIQAYTLDAGDHEDARRQQPVSFVDIEYDHPGPKPSYGIMGYTTRRQERRGDAPVRSVAPAARRIARRATSRTARATRARSASATSHGARFERLGGGGGAPAAEVAAAAAAVVDEHDRPVEADSPLGVRRVHEEGRLLRSSPTAS